MVITYNQSANSNISMDKCVTDGQPSAFKSMMLLQYSKQTSAVLLLMPVILINFF